MYWFAGLNDNDSYYKELYLAALESSKKTRLLPILLYNGIDETFINIIKSHNVNVIIHSPLFSHRPNFIDKPDCWKNTASGAFLRVDIPKICEKYNIQAEYVLYTDCDVIFMKDPIDELLKYKPMYFACSSEMNSTDFTNFNSGVMLLNVVNMLNTYDMFINEIDKNKYNYIAFDQGALQTFYKYNVDKLSILLNHKPYWGKNDDAIIVHYHGPKPRDILNYVNGIASPHDVYNYLFSLTNMEVWKYYLFIYVREASSIVIG
jgi:hypothetical protein